MPLRHPFFFPPAQRPASWWRACEPTMRAEVGLPPHSDSPREARSHGAGRTRGLANAASPLARSDTIRSPVVWGGRGVRRRPPPPPMRTRGNGGLVRPRRTGHRCRASVHRLPWPAVPPGRRRLRASVVQSSSSLRRANARRHGGELASLPCTALFAPSGARAQKCQLRFCVSSRVSGSVKTVMWLSSFLSRYRAPLPLLGSVLSHVDKIECSSLPI